MRSRSIKTNLLYRPLGVSTRVFLALMLWLIVLIPAHAKPADKLTDEQIIENAYKALISRSFRAVIWIKDERSGESPAVFVMSRRKDNTIRLEPIDKLHQPWFIIENDKGTLRVIPSKHHAFLIRRRRIGIFFYILERVFNPLAKGSIIAIERQKLNSHEQYLITATGPSKHKRDKAAVKVLLDSRDFLPRQIILLGKDGEPHITARFTSLQIMHPSEFPPGYFDIPPDCRIITQDFAGKAEIREKLGKMRRQMGFPEAGKQATKFFPLKKAGSDSKLFLPLLPTYLPEGFTVESIEPVWYEGSIIFHVKILDRDNLRLISIFQSAKPDLLTKQVELKRDGLALFVKKMDKGPISLFVSSDVGVDELRKIADTLEEDKKKVLELLQIEIEEKTESVPEHRE